MKPKGFILWLFLSFLLGVVFAYFVPTSIFTAMSPPLPALHKAAAEGDLRKVKALLKMGWPVDDIDYIEWDETALFLAARAGHIDIVKELVAHGADINHKAWTGATPLSEAFFGRNEEILKFLEEHGAIYDYEFMRLNYLHRNFKKK